MDQRSRLLAGLIAVCGVLLVPWTGVLIEQLHGQAGKRSFSSSWVGLDVLEAVCLLIVAALLSRRHRATSPVAAATAAILCMDAWFDTMSAAPQLPYAEALAMACFAELPLAALLALPCGQMAPARSHVSRRGTGHRVYGRPAAGLLR